MKEALVYQKLPFQKVRCLICQRKCLIAPGKTGFCLTKLNKNGKLYTLNYGLIRGIQVDPIEKKPFYHFRPGSLVPSIGSFGCNFRCKQCLNYWCSWGDEANKALGEQKLLLETNKEVSDQSLPPKELIKKIKQSGYQGIAFTYNEPVVWAEYVLDAAKLAKKEGLFTVFVTNGSWSKKTLDKIGPFIDAANIDLKGFSSKTYLRQGGFFGKIPGIATYAQKRHQIFIELTTVLIPGINDDPKEIKKMTQWIVKNLGPKTPWHLSRYDPEAAPSPKFRKIPATKIEQLEKAAQIGQQAGLLFVYIWAPGSDLPNGLYAKEDTICPKCKSVAIKRTGWKPNLLGITKKGNCQNCQEDLKIF